MIKSYTFGKYETTEGTFNTNIKIIDGKCTEWHPVDHHHIEISDIQEDIERKNPEIVVFAKGAYGVAKMMPETKKFMKEKNIELIALKSEEAIKKINELIKKGKKFVGFLHHTC